MTATPLSVQLYTVREAAAEDLPGTLQRLADIGFELVEPFGLRDFAPELAAALPAAGLRAPTAHQSFLQADDAELTELFTTARDLGVQTLIDPMHGPDHWQVAESVISTAHLLNNAATIAEQYGLKVGYHNHAHEISAQIDGITALEFLADHLHQDVALEVDAYWVAVGGQDPVSLLRRLGERVTAVHVKDGPGTPETLDQVAVGSGDQPIGEILAATPNALHVVELDDSRTDRFTAVEQSFSYLSGLREGA